MTAHPSQVPVPRPVVAVVQARLGSVRFPRKVLAPVLGQPLLGHLLDRLQRARLVDEVVLAVPEGDSDLVSFAADRGVRCVVGSEIDVLDRYHTAAKTAGAALVVRVTGDCPLVDPATVDLLVGRLVESRARYVRTGNRSPDGLDVEVFTIDALSQAWDRASAGHDREHVTPFIQRTEADRSLVLENDEEYSTERVTLDEPEDLEVIRAVFEYFGHNRFDSAQLAALSRRQPSLFDANRQLGRNEGAAMGTGEKLWKRAKRVIPGGNMLLSKRAELHLPTGWPAYYSKAKGCRIWDLDGREYLDVGFMGVGTNILGYGHPAVDEAVRKVIDNGNLSTLNAPEEVELAETLVEMHPWADMARFTRSGGEACAVAVRIARAAAGRSGVAICGYHGWHDWYLSTNLAAGSALDDHLLPGLDPAGVPSELAGITKPFGYNDLTELERLLGEGDVGVVFMEVRRSAEPAEGFLEGVRALANRYGAVLVFDECTSGFRKTFGGLHLDYGVDPDVMVLGKTLGNGYAVNAVVGRQAVMEAAQTTFISSTFWTERIGSAAALAALRIMREEEAPARIDAIGRRVSQQWEELAAGVGLPLVVSGLPALATYGVPHLAPAAVKTFVTQEMLGANLLATSALYACIAHDDGVLDAYFEALEPVFAALAGFESDGELLNRLPHGAAQSGFRRLA